MRGYKFKNMPDTDHQNLHNFIRFKKSQFFQKKMYLKERTYQ